MTRKINIGDVKGFFVEDGSVYLATNDGNAKKYGTYMNRYGDEFIVKTPTGEMVYMLKNQEGGIKTAKRIGDYGASAVISEADMEAVEFSELSLKPTSAAMKKLEVPPEVIHTKKYIGMFPGIGRCYDNMGTFVREDGIPLSNRESGFVHSWLIQE